MKSAGGKMKCAAHEMNCMAGKVRYFNPFWKSGLTCRDRDPAILATVQNGI